MLRVILEMLSIAPDHSRQLALVVTMLHTVLITDLQGITPVLVDLWTYFRLMLDY